MNHSDSDDCFKSFIAHTHTPQITVLENSAEWREAAGEDKGKVTIADLEGQGV